MTLSLPQLMWLADSKYGKNRMAFLVSMLRMTAMSSYQSIVNNITATVNVGQLERSEVQLAKDWKCDRKTVARVIETMNRLGIITTEKSNRTSVHIVHIVAAWVVDNVRIRNPYFRTEYDWRNLRQGTLNDVVPLVTFGQPHVPSYKKCKGNVPNGLSPSETGKTIIMPTVEGLELYDSQTTLAKEVSSDNGSPNGEVSISNVVPPTIEPPTE